MSFRSWWRNENYDPETMRAFYQTHPEWSDTPDDEVAQSFAFQAFAFGEAVREFRRELAKLIDPEDTDG